MDDWIENAPETVDQNMADSIIYNFWLTENRIFKKATRNEWGSIWDPQSPQKNQNPSATLCPIRPQSIWPTLPLMFCKFRTLTYFFELKSMCSKVKLKNPTHIGFCSEMPICQKAYFRHLTNNSILALFHAKLKIDWFYPSWLYHLNLITAHCGRKWFCTSPTIA